MDSFSQIIDTVTGFLYAGFRITLPVLVLCYLLGKSRKAFWLKLIVTSNIIFLGAAVIAGLKFFFDLVIYIRLVDDSVPNGWLMGPYWYTYWVLLIGQLLLPHLLWWKKNRWRYGVSVLLFVGISLGYIMRLIIMFSNNFHDYLPSSWTYYGPRYSELLVGLVGYGLLLGVGYFVLGKYTGLLVREEVIL